MKENTVFVHYFDRSSGPFRSLSALPLETARRILAKIKSDNRVFAAHRFDGYLERRLELEQIVRAYFVAKGGKPRLESPHYMVWEACPWLATWYLEAEVIAIPLAEFDPLTVSFTYGDSFPTFSPRVQDGKEYRNTVYTLDEIQSIIARYGLPQVWNADGSHGPERYIEAHVWSDVPIRQYCNYWKDAQPSSLQR